MKKGPKHSGRGLPPPWFRQCPKVNILFFRRSSLTLLLEIFTKIEKAGGQATLSVATADGKTKAKLEIVTSAANPTVSPSTSSTPGRRHRRRGAQARTRRNQRAAAHQASLAEAATSVPICWLSPPSTWTAPPLLLLLLHPPHLHPHNLSAMTTATSMSDTAKPVECVSFCALSMLVVLVTQLRNVFGTWNLNTTNWGAQFATAWAASGTPAPKNLTWASLDTYLFVIIFCSIIQCSVIRKWQLSLTTLINIDEKIAMHNFFVISSIRNS